MRPARPVEAQGPTRLPSLPSTPSACGFRAPRAWRSLETEGLEVCTHRFGPSSRRTGPTRAMGPRSFFSVPPHRRPQPPTPCWGFTRPPVLRAGWAGAEVAGAAAFTSAERGSQGGDKRVSDQRGWSGGRISGSQGQGLRKCADCYLNGRVSPCPRLGRQATATLHRFFRVTRASWAGTSGDGALGWIQLPGAASPFWPAGGPGPLPWGPSGQTASIYYPPCDAQWFTVPGRILWASLLGLPFWGVTQRLALEWSRVGMGPRLP